MSFRKLHEYTTGSGTSIWIETREVPLEIGRTTKATSAKKLLQRASTSFEETLEVVKPVVSTVMRSLEGLAQSAETIQVEFGVSLSAEAGAIVAAASAEANFKITVSWSPGQTKES